MAARDLEELAEQLDALKVQLISTINTAQSTDELTTRLMELSASNPGNADIYQVVLMVSYNNETNHNLFKQNTIRVITEMLSHKSRMVRLMSEQCRRLESIEGKFKELPSSLKTKFTLPWVGEVSVREAYLGAIMLFVVIWFADYISPETMKDMVHWVTHLIGGN